MPASDPIQNAAPTSEDAILHTGSQHVEEDASFGEQTQSETALDIPTPVLSTEPPPEPQESVSLPPIVEMTNFYCLRVAFSLISSVSCSHRNHSPGPYTRGNCRRNPENGNKSSRFCP